MGSFWIIKIISKYLNIDPLVCFFAIISILTAAFKPFLFVSILIIVHELGHFISAKLVGIEIDKIIIYPLGGIAKFKMPLFL